MANLVARYRPPDGGTIDLWSRPLPAEPVIVGQTEHPGATNMADWGIAEPGVGKTDRALVGGRHFEVVWDGVGLTVTPIHSPNRAGVRRANTPGDAPVGVPFLVRPGDVFTIGPFEFGLVSVTTPSGDPPPKPGSYIHTPLPPDPTPPRAPPTPTPTPDDPEPHGRELTFTFDAQRTPRSADLITANVLIGELFTLLDNAPLYANDKKKFAKCMLECLLRAIPHADVAGVVEVPVDGPPVTLVSEVRSSSAGLKFKKAELRQAAGSSQGILRLKHQGGAGPQPQDAMTLTSETVGLGDYDWWVYAPVDTRGNDRLVVCVNGVIPENLRTHAEIAELPELAIARQAAQVMSRLFGTFVQLLSEEEKNAEMRMFLPLPVRKMFDQGRRDNALEATVIPVTVLFCDLRNSTGLAERHTSNLDRLWADVLCKALNLMAGEVVARDGVIGSFLGDAVMAFWGWPDNVGEAVQVDRAIMAADGIWKEFEHATRDAKSEFAAAGLWFGIGIAHGPAVVGRLGTPEQHKVDVIGPTVNLAARLEGLSKTFKAQVLVDGPTAAALRRNGEHAARLRRVGWVVPRGIGRPIDLYELHTRLTEPIDIQTAKICQNYDEALRQFEAGRWATAAVEFGRIMEFDGAAEYLHGLIGGRAEPPTDWPRRDDDGACIIAVS